MSCQWETWRVQRDLLPKPQLTKPEPHHVKSNFPSLSSGVHRHLHRRDVPEDHRPGSLLLLPGRLEHLRQHHRQSESDGARLGQRRGPVRAPVLQIGKNTGPVMSELDVSSVSGPSGSPSLLLR